MNKKSWLTWLASAVAVAGCRGLVDRTDLQVYEVIADRQRAALGETHDASFAAEPHSPETNARMYSFNPRPIEPGIPLEFQTHEKPALPEAEPDAESASERQDENSSEISARIFTDAELENVTVFNLADALAYAMRHARDFQDAKEDLYIEALDLTLERHLWTPQFMAAAQATYEDFADDFVLDRAATTIGEIGVTQRLPYGGEVGAQFLYTLLRDVQEHVDKRETGQLILDARIPLLRGAGRIAYESRYAAEREMIYGVRSFERFRRTFVVNVAGEYFALQGLKAAVANTYKSYLSQKQQSEEADFKLAMARIPIFDAFRAKSSFRFATSSLVSIKQSYESGLDLFKIRIGMPVDAALDVVDQELDATSKAVDELLPDVDLITATDTAVRYRLDLLNSADRVDDARRGVVNAKNRILPDLELSGSVVSDSDPEQMRSTNLSEARSTWRGDISLRIDDRKSERNAYRAALIALRRAKRAHEEFVDNVRAEARRALRRIGEQDSLRNIAALNVKENELRLEAANDYFSLGKNTNQDVVDAENALLTARNDLASAVATYRRAILEFRRATGTLRVTDDGDWESPGPPAAPGGNAADDDNS